MAQETLEVRDTRVVWQFPGIEATDGRQDEVVRLDPDGVRLQISDRNLPLARGGIPFEPLDAVGQLEELVQAVLVRQAFPVALDLLALGELLRPLRVRVEGGLIDVCRNVTANPWIDILEPGASLTAPG